MDLIGRSFVTKPGWQRWGWASAKLTFNHGVPGVSAAFQRLRVVERHQSQGYVTRQFSEPWHPGSSNIQRNAQPRYASADLLHGWFFEDNVTPSDARIEGREAKNMYDHFSRYLCTFPKRAVWLQTTDINVCSVKWLWNNFNTNWKKSTMHICRQQLHINNLIRHKQLKKINLLYDRLRPDKYGSISADVARSVRMLQARVKTNSEVSVGNGPREPECVFLRARWMVVMP